MDNKVFNSHEEAFKAMHQLTANNKPFKLVFKKIDATIKIVPKALLRKRTHSSTDSNSAYKFNYLDVDKDECKSAYIPLLLSVNDKKIVLK
mgnify:CR=1 FL=1